MTELDNIRNLPIPRIDAARRQLNAAIRMHFRGDDELAVHTVAQATLGLMKGLLKKRSGKYIEDEAFKRGFFEIVKAHANGRLRDMIGELAEDNYLQEQLSGIPESMLKKFRAAKYDDVKLDLIGNSKNWEKLNKKFWNGWNKISNQLKHADREDWNQNINPDEIDNDGLLIFACGAYLELGLPLSQEMTVYHAYYNSLQSEHPDFGAAVTEMIETLKEQELAKRKAFCRGLIGDTIASS